MKYIFFNISLIFAISACSSEVKDERTAENAKPRETKSADFFSVANPDLTDAVEGMCTLCNNNGNLFPLQDRIDWLIDDSGQTCSGLSLSLADPENESTPGSQECTNAKIANRAYCCLESYTGGERKFEIETDDNKELMEKYGEGPHPQIHDGICRGSSTSGEKITNPYHLTAGLSEFWPSWANTCKKSDFAIKYGHIENRIVRPAQNYFRDPCGCDSTNDNNVQPVVESFMINEGATFTPNTEVNVSITVIGEPTEMLITNTAECSEEGANWTNYNDTFKWFIRGQRNVQNFVSIKVKDAAGNESECFLTSVYYADYPPKKSPPKEDDREPGGNCDIFPAHPLCDGETRGSLN